MSESREYRGDNNSLTYKQKFDFDRFGNLYRKVASNPTTGQANPIAFTPIEDTDISKATNQLATGTTYDEAGQVVADAKFRNMGFGYDANGRQVKATKTNQPDAATVYDGLGNRVGTKINDVWQYMVYDAFGQLVAEYGIQPEGMGGVKYIQQDIQGSVRTVTNSNGFVVARTDHQAFGDEVGLGVGLRTIEQGYSVDKVAKQGYGLTENDDATGQQHAWFRKLETQSGRWSSPDPYKGSMSLSNPQSFNRYSYVGNDPTNYVDPSGLVPAMCDISQSWQSCMATLATFGNGFWGGHSSGGTRGPGEPPSSSLDPNQPYMIDGIWFWTSSFNPAFTGFSGLARRDDIKTALDSCLRELFGVSLTSFTRSERGKNGNVNVNFTDPNRRLNGLTGFGVVNDVTSNSRKDLRATVNAAYAANGRPSLPANSILYGYTNPASPSINYTANDEGNSLNILKTQIHELGHSLEIIARSAAAGYSQYDEAGWKLENCVKDKGGFN